MNKFDVLSVIGEGAYGIVLKCRNIQTGELVAVKKMKESDEDEIVRKTTLREVKMLRMLRQDNIVELKEAFRRKGKLYLVFEYVEQTLLEVLEARRGGLSPEEVRQYIYQLVQAINWIHSHDAVHRDIKPENLLISGSPNPSSGGSTTGSSAAVGQLKLCDFGFSRQLPSNAADVSITDYVSTRWYRSPELLLGSSHYGKEVDIWAIGCIMAELSTGQPLFPGASDIDQLYLVQKMLGPLCRQHDILFLKNSRFAGLKFPDLSRPVTLDTQFHSTLTPDALAFLKGTLTMNPNQRLTCLQCLEHPYLSGLAHKDPRWQQQLRQLQASVAAAAAATAAAAAAGACAGTGSILCDSSTSTTTHLEDSACSAGPSAAAAAATSSPLSRPGSLASTGSPAGSLQPPSAATPPTSQQQQQQQRQGFAKQPVVPRLQLQQQPGIKAFPSSGLGAGAAGGSSSTSPSKTGTPRAGVGHAATHAGSGTASKQRQQQQSQQQQLQPMTSNKQLVPPKAHPVIRKQGSKGKAAASTTAAAAAAAAVSTAGLLPACKANAGGLHIGPCKPAAAAGGGQLEALTPRAKAASTATTAYASPVTRAKAASMAAALQSYSSHAPSAITAGAAAGAAAAADTAAGRAAAGAAGAAGAEAGGDVDMGEAAAESPMTSRRRKRLASGGQLGGASLRGGGRREIEGADVSPSSQQQQQQQARAAAVAPRRQQQSVANTTQQQQQWLPHATAAAAGSGGYNAPSQMDIDCGSGINSGGSSNSRPQSPLVQRAPACGAVPAAGPYGGNAFWGGSSNVSREAAAAAAAAAAGPGKWGGSAGLVCVSGTSLNSPHVAAALSPGAAQGRAAGLKTSSSAWAAAEPAGASGGGSSNGGSHAHLGSFGVAAPGLGGGWPEDAAAAAVAAAAATLGSSCSGGGINSRSSFGAAALPHFGDALSGLQAGSGSLAPVSTGFLYGRASISLQQQTGSQAAGAPRAQLSPGSLQHQQHSPTHQPYLHQHLYH